MYQFFVGIIDLAVRCLNVYIAMERLNLGRIAKRVAIHNMALPGVSLATTLKITSFLFSGQPKGRVF